MMKHKGKSLILKTFDRCQSFGQPSSQSSSALKSRASPAKKLWAARQGYFTVCVGADKERFMIRTECVNHPLFRLLLDDAETEYGFSSEGPLELPCNTDLFHRALRAMEQVAADAWKSRLQS